MGISKLVITHPLMSGPYFDLQVQKALSEQGAFIEHCFVSVVTIIGSLLKIAEFLSACRFESDLRILI